MKKKELMKGDDPLPDEPNAPNAFTTEKHTITVVFNGHEYVVNRVEYEQLKTKMDRIAKRHKLNEKQRIAFSLVCKQLVIEKTLHKKTSPVKPLRMYLGGESMHSI
jgi:hypothetical protein